jgi:hypothetical protein
MTGDMSGNTAVGLDPGGAPNMLPGYSHPNYADGGSVDRPDEEAYQPIDRQNVIRDRWMAPAPYDTSDRQVPFRNAAIVRMNPAYTPGSTKYDVGIGRADGGSVGLNPYIPSEGWMQSKSGAPQVADDKAAKSDGGFGDIVATAAKILPMFLNSGGKVDPSVAFNKSPEAYRKPITEPPSFRDRWEDVRSAVDDGTWDPQGKNYNRKAFSGNPYGYADGGRYPGPEYTPGGSGYDGPTPYRDDMSGKPGDDGSTWNWNDQTKSMPEYPSEPNADWDNATVTPQNPMSRFGANGAMTPYTPPTAAAVNTDTDVVPDPGFQNVPPVEVDAWRKSVDGDRNNGGNPYAPVQPAATPAATTGDDSEEPVTAKPPATNAVAAPAAASDASPYKSDDGALPYGDLDIKGDTSRKWAKSPWMALIQAGAAMMASDSPYLGVGIGKGIEAGAKTLAEQRKALESEEGVNARARQLMQQASFHNDQYTKLTKAQQMTLEQQERAHKLSLAQQERAIKRQEGTDRISQQRADANDRLVAAAEQRASAAAKRANEEKPDKVQDQVDAARLKALNIGADAAEKSLASIDALERLYKDAYMTGPLFGRLGNSIGANDAALAEVNQAALNANAQLKGSTSNNDINLLRQSTPNLQMNEAQFKESVNIRRAMQTRVIQKGDFMQHYREAKGSLVGADSAWRKFMHENELSMADPKDKNKRIFNPNYNNNFSGYLSGKSRAERYAELVKSGLSAEQSFAQMEKDGY